MDAERPAYFAALIFLAACAGNSLPPPGDMGIPAGACDPLAQSCGTGLRCAVASDGSTRCTSDGTTGRDQPCSFDSSTKLDQCAAGTACSNATLPTGTAVCRKLCSSDADCGAGQRCHPLTAWGECLPSCVAFGSQCPGGMTCGGLTADVARTDAGAELFLTCRALGTGQTGDACVRASDCGANAICATRKGNAFCTPLCDSTHACPAMLQCGVVDGVAVCQ